ncbi:predicted polisoprenol-linked O-antigen transporter [Aliivibrio fischeri ES114]|uniref:Predicted polisoprenol-linked O-antigen transporter n=1 Tax=Aliivibrio fischeri (strain ATCC 700601 / ES114) TaxID=312309 RepID=Q5E8I1_ALIF1|nr:flippase [Aliivibrio fischeri]AAW84665.1 predicted polisoprenol-linked O-antigen transporter [Aliivibrio fischeri ES114]KLU78885.1 hypothetical protein AB192_09635 [Aliivibrio fischeri]
MKLKGVDNKILSNIFSLLSVQGALYIIPLITLPYLVRTLGVENYGVFGFSLAIVSYMSLIVDYGFNITATKTGAEIRYDKNKLSKLFFEILYSKLFMFIICSLSSILFSFFVENNIFNKDIIFVLMFTVFSQVIFPIWFFQAIEELKLVATLNFISKSLSVPLIFILINDEKDLIKLAVIHAITTIIPAIYSVYYIHIRKLVFFYKPSLNSIVSQIKNGWHIFLSGISISFYSTIVTVFLGIFSGATETGYFVAADRLRKAVQGISGPISQSFYPRINSLINTNKKSAINLIKVLYKIQFIVTFILSSLLFIFSEEIVEVLYGNGFVQSIVILKVLSYVPFFVSMSNASGICVIVSFGFNRLFSKIMMFSGGVGVALSFLLINSYGAIGSGLSILISEFIIAIIMIYFVIKLKLLKQ